MNSLTTSGTILVADDHEALCELIEIILTRDGYRVFTATNGARALQLARELPAIDLLLSDIEMPVMRGDDLARRFSALHPSTPVVFISSAPPPPGTCPSFNFVNKPFTVAELCDTVRRTLRTRPVPGATALAE